MATQTGYKRVATNISKESNSYRVRLKVKGKQISKNFTTKKAALEFRAKYI
jgi:hypothetical protein